MKAAATHWHAPCALPVRCLLSTPCGGHRPSRRLSGTRESNTCQGMRCQRGTNLCPTASVEQQHRHHLATLHPAHSSSFMWLSETPSRAVHLHAPQICIHPGRERLKRALQGRQWSAVSSGYAQRQRASLCQRRLWQEGQVPASRRSEARTHVHAFHHSEGLVVPTMRLGSDTQLKMLNTRSM